MFTGKDYLKLAKSPSEAILIFRKMLKDASAVYIYVASEVEDYDLLPEDAIKIRLFADLGIIAERFAKRMKGPVSEPIMKMLAKKQSLWEQKPSDLAVDSGLMSVQEISDLIQNRIEEVGRG